MTPFNRRPFGSECWILKSVLVILQMEHQLNTLYLGGFNVTFLPLPMKTFVAALNTMSMSADIHHAASCDAMNGTDQHYVASWVNDPKTVLITWGGILTAKFSSVALTKYVTTFTFLALQFHCIVTMVMAVRANEAASSSLETLVHFCFNWLYFFSFITGARITCDRKTVSEKEAQGFD